MPFEKGHKKATGRPKGSPNLLDKEAKKLFLQTLGNQSQHIQDAFDTVRAESPAKYLELVSKYIGYWVAKKSEVLEIQDSSRPSWLNDLMELDDETLKDKFNE